MNLKSVADQFREIDRGAERSAQVNTTFIYEDKRSSVLVDRREGQTLHVVYEPQCSLTSASMMGGVILLIPSHTQGEPLSVDQRLMLSCTHRAGAKLIVCFEEQRFSKLKALLTNVSLNREQREVIRSIKELGWSNFLELSWNDTGSFYQQLLRCIEQSSGHVDIEGAHRPKSEMKTVSSSTASDGRLIITHIFEGHRRYRTGDSMGGRQFRTLVHEGAPQPGAFIEFSDGFVTQMRGDSRGGLLVRASVREGSVQLGDLVEVRGALCRVRSRVKHMERWRDRITRASSGEMISLILEDVFYTEVELGDEIHVLSQADEHTSRIKSHDHQYDVQADHRAYEDMVQIGCAIREDVRRAEPEGLARSLERLTSLKSCVSEPQLIALRETLGGLIFRRTGAEVNSAQAYNDYIPMFDRIHRGFGDAQKLSSLREIKLSLVEILSRTTHYRELSRQIGDLRSDQEIKIVFVEELIQHPYRFELVIDHPDQLTHLHITGLRDTGHFASRCKQLNTFVRRLPQLVKLTIDRPVNHELYLALRSYPRLLKLMGDPDELRSMEVSDGERLRTLLCSEGPDLVYQMVELAMNYPERVQGVHDELSDLLEGGDPSRLWRGAQLRASVSPRISEELICAVYAALLKVTGAWAEVTKLTLNENPELIHSGIFDHLTHITALTLSSSDLIQYVSDLPNLTCLEVWQVKDLHIFRELYTVNTLKSVRFSSLSSELLIELAEHPELLTLLEASYRERVIPKRDRAHLVNLLNLDQRELTNKMKSRLINLVLCGLRVSFSSEMKGVEFAFIYCPTGTQAVGAPDDAITWSGEPEYRQIEIKRPFLMGQTQVTQALWNAAMVDNPSEFKGDLLPLEHASWIDCARFCNALNEAEGLPPSYDIQEGDEITVRWLRVTRGYRMPTEREWEYAARAGTALTYAGAELDELNEVAWYDENSHKQTHPVGRKRPNKWGLYDMTGNVTEWCDHRWYLYEVDVDNPEVERSLYRFSQPDAEGTDRGVCRGGDCGLSWFHSAVYARNEYTFGSGLRIMKMI